MALVAHSRTRLDLSGPWQLAFDPGGEGIREWPGTGQTLLIKHFNKTTQEFVKNEEKRNI